MTVILSMGMRLLRFQYFFFMFDILSVKFRANTLSRLVSNVIHNSLILSTPQFSFHLVFIESVLYFLNLSIPHLFLRN